MVKVVKNFLRQTAFHLLILCGNWLYLWSPPGTESTLLFWRAVWLRRRVSDQINVKTIRSRQNLFASLAAERRQIKGNLHRTVKANCRHEDRIFSATAEKSKVRTILRSSRFPSPRMHNTSNAHVHVQIGELLGVIGISGGMDPAQCDRI